MPVRGCGISASVYEGVVVVVVGVLGACCGGVGRRMALSRFPGCLTDIWSIPSIVLWLLASREIQDL